jgi:single-strand DNA-binding protein
MTRDNEQRSNVRVPNINSLTIAGRLGNDPDLRYTQSGVPVANFDICNTRYFKNNNGDKAEESCWVSVTVWEKLAEYVGEHLKKGSPVIVEGRLKQETWDDKDTGAKRSRLKLQANSIHTLEWEDRGDGGGRGDRQGGGREEGGRRQEPEKSPYRDGDDEEAY